MSRLGEGLFVSVGTLTSVMVNGECYSNFMSVWCSNLLYFRVGVELNEPKGKNDGRVNEFEYFRCKMNHGMFVRPSKVEIVEQPAVRSMPPPVSLIGFRVTEQT